METYVVIEINLDSHLIFVWSKKYETACSGLAMRPSFRHARTYLSPATFSDFNSRLGKLESFVGKVRKCTEIYSSALGPTLPQFRWVSGGSCLWVKAVTA